jgi:Uri superfamily endonuclease
MNNIAYLAGVLKGDGYLYRGQSGRPRFQVETTSGNFAQKIARALEAMGYATRIARYRHRRTWIHPKKTYHYDYLPYSVRVTLSYKSADTLQNFEPSTLGDKKSFVTGFFESEGTARRQVYHNRICYRIAIYNRELSLLRRVQQFVAAFGLEMKLRDYDSRVPFLELQDRAGFNKFLTTFGEKV